MFTHLCHQSLIVYNSESNADLIKISMTDQIYWILFSIPSILIASTVHEYSHALSASKLGDPTARMNGRLTLNPLAHIDPVGAIAMMLFRFGWSKPVPINEYNFKNPVIGTAITSFAGPASNLLLATISALIFRVFLSFLLVSSDALNSNFFGIFLLTFLMVNISLAVFNLLPIPPLDGHKIVRAFLPKSLRYYWESLEGYGIWILALMFLPISPLYTVTSHVLTFMLNTILLVLVG